MEGNFEGQGQYWWPNGATFKGSWANNVPDMKGEYVNPAGIAFVKPEGAVGEPARKAFTFERTVGVDELLPVWGPEVAN